MASTDEFLRDYARHHRVTLARFAPMELEGPSGSCQGRVTASLTGFLHCFLKLRPISGATAWLH